MIDLSKYRIIDLSREIVPGERKIDGRYLHGEPRSGRPTEVQEFVAYGARMHFIQGHTHCGTHAESTCKYEEGGADVTTMPLDSYLGEAAACNLEHKGAGEPVMAVDFRKAGVATGDIVLAWGHAELAENKPYVSLEAMDWLLESRIKLMATENCRLSPPGTPFGPGAGDARLLMTGIPLVDGVDGLSRITRKRVFFIALPTKLRRVSASWTRAIALEEI